MSKFLSDITVNTLRVGLEKVTRAASGVLGISGKLKLGGNAIQDSGGTDRVTTGTVTPQVTLTGDVLITGANYLEAPLASTEPSGGAGYRTFARSIGGATIPYAHSGAGGIFSMAGGPLGFYLAPGFYSSFSSALGTRTVDGIWYGNLTELGTVTNGQYDTHGIYTRYNSQAVAGSIAGAAFGTTAHSKEVGVAYNIKFRTPTTSNGRFFVGESDLSLGSQLAVNMSPSGPSGNYIGFYYSSTQYLSNASAFSPTATLTTSLPGSNAAFSTAVTIVDGGDGITNAQGTVGVNDTTSLAANQILYVPSTGEMMKVTSVSAGTPGSVIVIRGVSNGGSASAAEGASIQQAGSAVVYTSTGDPISGSQVVQLMTGNLTERLLVGSVDTSNNILTLTRGHQSTGVRATTASAQSFLEAVVLKSDIPAAGTVAFSPAVTIADGGDGINASQGTIGVNNVAGVDVGDVIVNGAELIWVGTKTGAAPGSLIVNRAALATTGTAAAEGAALIQSGTAFSYTCASGNPMAVGSTIIIESERMLIGTTDTTNKIVGVTRGADGCVVAAHTGVGTASTAGIFQAMTNWSRIQHGGNLGTIPTMSAAGTFGTPSATEPFFSFLYTVVTAPDSQIIALVTAAGSQAQAALPAQPRPGTTTRMGVLAGGATTAGSILNFDVYYAKGGNLK